MAKNILLIFISKVGIDSNTGKVRQTFYNDIGETFTTNESALRYILKTNSLDKIFAFASKVVLKKPIGARDTENLTQYGYFKKRLKDLGLDVENLFTEDKDAVNAKGSVYPYDEMQLPDSERAVWKSMGQIVEMASRIQNYVQAIRQENPGEEIILHVDSTGGPRDAAMMIIGILRLMEYQKITIGKILYSNFESHTVDEVNEIYNLFDLIAGAEEFVRFGSVDAIQNYFSGRTIPKVLQKLLDAMNQFAQAIKISRRTEFQRALENLQDAYKKFGAESENFSTVNNIPALNYNLVQQLKIRITQEYAALLERSADDYVSIIDWCLDHGYIQQALVLYTEAFPYLIVAKDKLLAASPDIIKDLDKCTAKDTMHREKEFLLINDFDPKGYDSKPIFNAYEKFIGRLKDAAKAIRLGTFDFEKFQKDNSGEGLIQSDYENYLDLLRDLQKLKSNTEFVADLETFSKNLPTLYSFWDLIPEDIFKIPANGRVKKILLTFEQTSNKSDAYKQKNNNTLIIYHMIRHGGIIDLVDIDEETFLKIIDRYFIVKSERNDSVHARRLPKKLLGGADSKKSYSELLKAYMKEGLQEYSAAVMKFKSDSD